MKTCIILILFIFNAYSQDQVSCSNGDCSFSGNLNVSNETEFLNYSQFEIEFLESDIEINLPEGEIPRNFRSLIRTQEMDGQDFSLNLSSSNKDHDSAQFILFSDVIDLLQINTSGYDGIISNDASVICSNNIKNGVYGQVAKNFYEQRRSSDPLIEDKCDSVDVTYLQTNNFSCEEGNVVNTEEVNAQRWEERSQCGGNAFRFLCLDRRLNLNCRWLADGGDLLNQTVCCDQGATQPPGGDWQCVPNLCSIGSNNSGWVKDQVAKEAESVYNSYLLNGESNLQICNRYFNRTIEQPYFDQDMIFYGFFSGSFRDRPGSLNTNIKYPNNDPSSYTLIPELTEYSGGAVGKCSSYNSCFTDANLDLANANRNNEIWTDMNTRFSLGSGGYFNNDYELECETNSSRTQCNLWIDNDNKGEGWDKVTAFSYFIKYKFLSKQGYLVEQVHAIGRGHE